jgi:hypothetical protein
MALDISTLSWKAKNRGLVENLYNQELEKGVMRKREISDE